MGLAGSLQAIERLKGAGCAGAATSQVGCSVLQAAGRVVRAPLLLTLLERTGFGAGREVGGGGGRGKHNRNCGPQSARDMCGVLRTECGLLVFVKLFGLLALGLPRYELPEHFSLLFRDLSVNSEKRLGKGVL